jgi:hypothetical protein
VFTKKTTFWERFYVAISSQIALLPPESKNRQSSDIARKRRSTARLQTDARPSRDGSERFGSGTEAYGQI